MEMLAVAHCIGQFSSFSLRSTLRHICGTYIAVMMMSWCDDDICLKISKISRMKVLRLRMTEMSAALDFTGGEKT